MSVSKAILHERATRPYMRPSHGPWPWRRVGWDRLPPAEQDEQLRRAALDRGVPVQALRDEERSHA